MNPWGPQASQPKSIMCTHSRQGRLLQPAELKANVAPPHQWCACTPQRRQPWSAWFWRPGRIVLQGTTGPFLHKATTFKTKKYYSNLRWWNKSSLTLQVLFQLLLLCCVLRLTHCFSEDHLGWTCLEIFEICVINGHLSPHIWEVFIHYFFKVSFSLSFLLTLLKCDIVLPNGVP